MVGPRGFQIAWQFSSEDAGEVSRDHFAHKECNIHSKLPKRRCEESARLFKRLRTDRGRRRKGLRAPTDDRELPALLDVLERIAHQQVLEKTHRWPFEFLKRIE